MPLDDDIERKPDKEGVRIIGAEEAAEAAGRDDVVPRRGRDEPKFGDRPAAPASDGPRPTIRFPLPSDEVPERGSSLPPDDTALPHWTEPATGEVPRIFAAEDLDDTSSWSAFSSGQPRWRGEGDRHDDDDHDFSQLGDHETRVGAMADEDRAGPEDFFAFDDEEDEWEPEVVRVGAIDDDYDDDDLVVGRTRSISSDPRRSTVQRRVGGFDRPDGPGRNVPVAVGVGVAFAVVAVLALYSGSRFTVALVAAVLVGAAMELYTVLRQAGYQPATLLGLCAVLALPLAAYWRGESGIPVVLFLTVVFGLLWYLAGAGGADRPVIGLSSTLFGVGWIGVLGSTAALMLVLPTTTATTTAVAEPGTGVLLIAIIGAVAYDVGGFVIGRNAGSRPLSAASPNKTIEGLVGGVVVSVLAVVIATLLSAPFSELGLAPNLLLALGIAVAAPLGDLCQSLVKRDLDVKDMGTLLPGHGGLLDRFDGMLFVLPVAYYLARVLLY